VNGIGDWPLVRDAHASAGGEVRSRQAKKPNEKADAKLPGLIGAVYWGEELYT
jgi:hypothetical protein